MITTARTRQRSDAHYYHLDGRPCYELPKKDGKGMKVPTLADARKLNLLPSVTTILKVLAKPALIDWMIEQACLAVLTAPRNPGEEMDAFVHRVLHLEEQQHEERDAAADKGKAIHDGLEAMSNGEPVASTVIDFVTPVFLRICEIGEVLNTEFILVGDGYAGKSDMLVLSKDQTEWLIDFKTTKKLPEKSSWPEHRSQLAAYAKAHYLTRDNLQAPNNIKTMNVYISSQVPGQFICHENPPWQDDYEQAFQPVLKYWQWLNNYHPSLVSP